MKRRDIGKAGIAGLADGFAGCGESAKKVVEKPSILEEAPKPYGIEIPAVRQCPISPQGTFNFYWMLAAEIAMRDKSNEAMRSTEKAGEYIELIKQRGAKIRANFGTIDTFSPDRDGAITIPGLNRKICPTTGVLYALCQYMLNAQFIGHMIEADMTPCLYMGVHLIGGIAYNNLMQEIWSKRGY